MEHGLPTNHIHDLLTPRHESLDHQVAVLQSHVSRDLQFNLPHIRCAKREEEGGGREEEGGGERGGGRGGIEEEGGGERGGGRGGERRRG